MQIFKCLNKNKNLNAQNLVEFIFILPIIIFVTLVIFEVALFWQDVNTIYNLNAEINANVALIDNSGMNLGDTCAAATKALDILKKKDKMITMSTVTYASPLIIDGEEPFALYEYPSTTTVNVDGTQNPQVALWVDCRNPFEDGVTTQLEFYHKTLIIKAKIPNFTGGKSIEVIPENIFIASPKLNTLRQY